MSSNPRRRTGAAFVTPGRKVYREKLFNPGSLFCVDVGNSFSANGIADGAVATGSILKSITPGGASVTARVSSAGGGGSLTKASGSIERTGANAAIDFGRTYDMSASQHAFMVTCWFDPDDVTTNAQIPIMTFMGTAFANSQYVMTLNPSTRQLFTQIGAAGGTAYTLPDLALKHIGMAWSLGSTGVATLQLIVNGLVVSTKSDSGVPTVLPTPEATGSEGFGSYGNGGVTPKIGSLYSLGGEALYRAYKEDLTISAALAGLTAPQQAIAQAAAEWNANHARFGI